MSRETIGLDGPLREYLLGVSLRESPVLQELRQATSEIPGAGMQISPEQGQFMALLVKITGAKEVLEVGTFTGYSALAMAEALPEDGRVLTLDVNPETTELAKTFWRKAGLDTQIESRLGPALENLQGLEGPYDLAFIDADKTSYDDYYERILTLLKPGGLMLLDNVLWGGSVIDPEATDPDTTALMELNRKLRDDQRIDLSLLPIGDGLTLARKRSQ